MQFATSKMVTKPLYLAAKLGIADLLKGGSKPVHELARATKTDERSLYRLLRALSGFGIFAETGDRAFQNTPPSKCLLDEPGSMRAVVLFMNDPAHDKAWEKLLHSVRTGKPGAQEAYGADVFEYLFKRNPEFGKVFNDAMTSFASNDIAAITVSYDFSGFKKIVDVGGGHGALMRAILAKNPGMTGVVFDMPGVADGARKTLEAAGLAGRCEVVGGDFFKAVPSADAIIMSHIIHDWDDEKSLAILKNCHKALPAGGKLLLAETVLPNDKNTFSVGHLIDMEMLVMTGGCERTESEYSELLAKAGFKLTRVVASPAPISVVESVKD
jgi:cyclopropane fatty-acyl-phospholipid synthase-like methyltransferase